MEEAMKAKILEFLSAWWSIIVLMVVVVLVSVVVTLIIFYTKAGVTTVESGAGYAYTVEKIEYDGCEYLAFHIKGTYSNVVIHKGNCANPIHRREK
jgi:hypothetical protein